LIFDLCACVVFSEASITMEWMCGGKNTMQIAAHRCQSRCKVAFCGT